MGSLSKRWGHPLIAVWTGVVLLFFFIPIAAVIASSFSKSRYFSFPVKAWTTKWYDETLSANLTENLHVTSFYVAGCVAVIALVLGFFGALAFARYDWKGRIFYQRLIMLPIFFPQAVLGLALLLWFTYVGVLPSWEAAVFAHLVWIVVACERERMMTLKPPVLCVSPIVRLSDSNHAVSPQLGRNVGKAA